MKIIRSILLGLLIFLPTIDCFAQTNNKLSWDDTNNGQWNEEFEEVWIPSSFDNTSQGSIIYKAKSDTPRPLIVSLHTWSGNYKQEDRLARLIVDYDYNYIHPDFRGANNNPKACGSNYVIADLEDAIEYAISNMNVDRNEVHIVGTSGGGYATLIAYMNIKFPAKSFSAWVPLSNLEAWYWESVGRKQKYAQDILICTDSKDILNVEEARKRSPYFQKYPELLRKDAKLSIFTGIHDGYTGSVPITQSVDMYNKLVKETVPADQQNLVSDADKLQLIVNRCYPLKERGRNIGDRKVHYEKQNGNISLTIFEGGHEQIVNQVIPLMPIDKKYEPVYKKILNLGDSNSSFEYSWPQLLTQKSLQLKVRNYGIPGNTVGYDNLGQKQLNSLANIDSLLTLVERETVALDYVIISLGTNDCKAIFDKRQNEAKKNFDKLIKKIKTSPLTMGSKIIVLSIPPADISKINEKYYGIDHRIIALNDYYKKQIVSNKNIIFLDTYSLLLPNIASYTEDGIHLNEKAQQLITDELLKIL